MLNIFMILKLKFNKVVAFNIISHMYPAEIFIRGIETNSPWLCEHTYRPQYLKLEIEDISLIAWAASNGYLETAKWLYSVGADPRARDDDAITWAANNGHLEMAKWLYSVGADPRAQRNHSITLASYSGHLEMAKWLYSVGCDPRTEDDYTIKWAMEGGYTDVIKWLESIGCKL
jgi:ankyrin repeat protein